MTGQQAPRTTAATPELVRLINDSLLAKSRGDIEEFMDSFSRESTVYIDPTLRLIMDGWAESRGAAIQLVSSWPPEARSYATKIIGDETSGIVFMVDSKEMFGAEIRTVSPVDLDNGKITRWVDYWNGLNWPQEHLANVRLPAEQFPDDFKESSVGERATPTIRAAAGALAGAFAGGDSATVMKLLSPDAEFDDLGLNVHLVGREAVGLFLKKSLRLLPYGGGATVRHVVGGNAGGGYEWTSGPDSHQPGLRGVTALELDNGRIYRVTSAWNAEALPRKALASMYQQTFQD